MSDKKDAKKISFLLRVLNGTNGTLSWIKNINKPEIQ